ncbi:MAG: hypothetical protein IPH35_10520 [Rhodoferax sp.]|nr:hypothetical protein [Rhodoferax sp.]
MSDAAVPGVPPLAARNFSGITSRQSGLRLRAGKLRQQVLEDRLGKTLLHPCILSIVWKNFTVNTLRKLVTAGALFAFVSDKSAFIHYRMRVISYTTHSKSGLSLKTGQARHCHFRAGWMCLHERIRLWCYLYEKHSCSRLVDKAYSQICLEFCPSERLKAMLIPPWGFKTGRFRVFLHAKSGYKPYVSSGSSSYIRSALAVAGSIPELVTHPTSTRKSTRVWFAVLSRFKWDAQK